jgi:hypothetical protein
MMRVGRVTRTKRARRSQRVGGGGGLSVADFVRQTLNAGTGNNVALTTGGAEGSVQNGNTVFACGSNRTGSTTSTPTPGIVITSGSDTVTSLAIAGTHDGIGVSRGLWEAGYVNVSSVGTYGAADYIYNNIHSAVGIEMKGLWTISSVLASATVQQVNSDPNVASVPGGDSYAALLVVMGCSADDYTAAQANITASITPSVDGVYSFKNAVNGGRQAQAFIGVLEPTTGAITLTMTTKGFLSGGWSMRVFGINPS